jgi:enoyl-CoA hydratase/carnithine racemase
MRYLLTGDEITAEEALRLGLVQQVTEPEKELETALDLAKRIARAAPLGVMAALKSARIARTEGHRAAMARLIPDLLPLIESEDVKEGLLSFMERREAVFKGK